MELLNVGAIWGVILILAAGILAYMQAGSLAWAASIFAVITGYAFHARPDWWVIAGLALAFLVPFCLLAIPRFRRPLISDRLSERFSAAAPPTAQHGASIWCSELFRKGSGWREILRFPRTHLTVEEQRALLDDLSETDNPYRCPHGRPIVLRLSQEEMERRLGRR